MSKTKLTIIFLLIISLIAAVCFWVIPQIKKETSKVYRVGVIWTAGEFFADLFSSFKEKMTELGYIEGKNIAYDVYMAPLPVGNEQTIQKFVDKKVDLIFSFATEASIEAKAVAGDTGIPIVFSCTFVEKTGLIESVSHPGDNITGVRYPTTESAIGRLEILHEIAPEAKRVWVPCLKDYPTVSPQLKAIEPIASALDITLIEQPLSTPAEVKAYLDERATSADIGMDAILLMAEPFSITPEVTDVVYKFAQEHQLPISSAMVLKDSQGPIVGFHPTNTKMGSLAAIQADKVLKGMSAGTIPVVTAENDLRINYKLIQQLGLTISDDLLSRAIEVVR